MGLAARKQIAEFTYSDYLSRDDSERWEIICGEAYNMSPAPDTIHQLISMELTFQLKSQLKEKSCQVIPAPFDVRLPVITWGQTSHLPIVPMCMTKKFA